MATDIKLNNDSVEVEGPLKLKRIIGELAVTGGVSVVGFEEHIANGFTHLVLKPDSLVFETFHMTAPVKRFDVKQEILKIAADLKNVVADVQAIKQRTKLSLNELQAANMITVGPPVEMFPVNTPVPQMFITNNKIALRTVVQPGIAKPPGSVIPGPPLGTPVGPPQFGPAFELIAENQALKQQIAALERRLTALESKVK